jgi:hypothetical protein
MTLHGLTRWANAGIREAGLTITCGIDWAENHTTWRWWTSPESWWPCGVSDDAEGYRRLLDLLAETGDTKENPIPVAVETARGLLISCLRATGRTVYSINPLAVARYRERHRVARAKSDHADAMALANILRTDAEMHRPLPADSELVQRSRCSPARSRTRCGIAGSCPINCARTSNSTSRPRLRRSRCEALAWTYGCDVPKRCTTGLTCDEPTPQRTRRDMGDPLLRCERQGREPHRPSPPYPHGMT